MRQLELADALFVLTEQPSRNTQHIGMIFVFDPSTASGPVTYDDVLALYARRLPLARCFRERLVRVPLDIDYPYWVNDGAFDLEFHVRHSALPRPGDRKQFLALASRLMSLPLDMSRPLWETWYIEGLDAVEGVPPGSFALLMKMHHAAVDGVSGMEMVTAILEDDETAAARMPSKPWKPEKLPDQRKLLMKAVGSNWKSPLKLADTLMRAMPTIAGNRKKLKSGEIVKPTKTKAPKTRFNGVVTPHRVLDGRSFALSDIKRIKNAIADATINDVVIGIVGGALRRYLSAKGELPAESLVATVMLSTRGKDEAGTGGNRVSFAYVSTQSDIADPVQRIVAVGEAMRVIKEYHSGVDARTLQNTTAAMPGMLMGLAMKAMYSLPLSDKIIVSNAVITNVPGPLDPKTLLGARYVEGFASGPSTNGVGLFHSVISLSGVISISFNACREIMGDPEFYGQCIAESYAELAAAVDDAAKAPALPKPAVPATVD